MQQKCEGLFYSLLLRAFYTIEILILNSDF